MQHVYRAASFLFTLLFILYPLNYLHGISSNVFVRNCQNLGTEGM